MFPYTDTHTCSFTQYLRAGGVSLGTDIVSVSFKIFS